MKYTVKDEGHIEATLGHGTITISSNEKIGYRPVEMLVTSIASCSGFVFYNILKKQRTELTELSIEADVERNESEANRVDKVILHFTVTGKNLNEDKLLRNLDITRKHCGMVQSVEDSINIEKKFTVINE